jgi:hypothetical protein
MSPFGKRALRLAAASVFVVLIGLLFPVNLFVLAHGKTTVGDYELTIGFHNEPTIVDEPNSLDLFVKNTKTGEMVNGLEKTLHAEIIFGSARKQLDLEPQEDLDGAYGADVLPTRVGDYTWHIFGDINGTAVDVSMTSSPDTFGSGQAKSDLSFPDAEPSTADLRAMASDAAQTAQTALIVGVVGTVLGLVGTVVGIVGLRAAQRKPKP